MKPITSLLMTFFVFFVGINTALSTVVLTLTPTASSPNIGDIVEYQVTATGFEQISSMNFALQFDTTKLTYLNNEVTFYESPLDEFALNLNPSPKYLKIVYTYIDNSGPEPLGKTVADGAILFKVRFTRIAIGTAPVIFNADLLPAPEFSHITTGLISPVATTPTTISAPGMPPSPSPPFTIFVEKDTVQTGKVACIDIKTLSFDSIASLQFGILYDTTRLTFKELRLCHSLLGLTLGSNITAPTTPTSKKQIRVLWGAPNDSLLLGNGITLPDNATLFGVCFTVTGAANSLATITLPTMIPNPPGADFVADFQNIPGAITNYTLTNGHVVASNNATPTFTLGNNTVPKGQTTCVDVKVKNFTLIDTFTLNVMYDTLKLKYTNFMAGSLTGASATLNPLLYTVNGRKMRQIRIKFPNQTTPVTLNDNTTAFSLCFQALDTTNNPTSTAVVFQEANFACPNAQLFTDVKEKDPDLVNGSVTIGPAQVPCDATNTPNLSLTSGVTKTNVACFNGATGSITIAPTGGTTPYSITWTGPNGPLTATGATISNLLPGFYVPVITGVNGCSATTGQVAQLQITQPSAALTLTQGNIVNAACKSASTGSINISKAGGTGNVNYVWKNASTGITVGTSEDILGLPAGNYNVTATDENGCTATFTNPLTITEPTIELAITGTPTNVTCNGGNNGAILLSVTGGNSGTANFTWTPNLPNSANVTGLSAGAYNVVVTDGGGCSKSAGPFNITAPSNITASNTIVPTGCAGSQIGSIALTNIAGANGAPYNVSWNNGAFTGTSISNLPVGNYTPIITDSQGCSRTLTSISVPTSGSTITQNPVTITPASCVGFSNGSIQITPSSTSGGPYTVNWSVAGQTGDTLSNLSAGTYSVTIIDAILCAQPFTHTVTNAPNNIAATFATTPDSCGTINRGTISPIALPSGGAGAPYSIIWSNTTQTGTNLVNLNEGIYTPTITDMAGCSKVLQSVTVGLAPNNIAITTLGVTPTACNGSNTGAIAIQVTGASGIPTINWGGGLAGLNITGLSAGTYKPTVTDANGCTKEGQNIVVSNGQFLPQVNLISVTNTSCNAGTNGSIQIQVSNTVGTPQVSWGGNLSGTSITNLSAGIYTPTITDSATGCTKVGSPITVGVSPNLPTIAPGSVSVNNVSCFGDSNGSITISPSGGAAPYQVAWTPFGTGSTISNLPGNIYTPTVTDAAGCSFTPATGYTVNDATQIDVDLDIVTNQTTVTPNGSVSIGIVSGGAGGYTYLWSPGGATTQNLTNIAAGNYTVTIKDANGCTQQFGTYTVILDLQTVLTIEKTVTGSCGPNNGCVDFVVNGGTPNYTLSWSGAASGTMTSTDNSPQACGLAVGNYSFTITDGSGNTVTSTATIVQLAPVQVNTVVENPNDDFMNGTISVTPQAGTGPYTYAWALPITTAGPIVTNLDQGTYTVTITNNASGCTAVESFTLIRVYPPVNWNITIGKTKCPTTCDGQLTFVFSGANGPNYGYKVTSPANNFTYTNSGQALLIQLSNLCTGNYLLEITDESGTVHDSLVTITSQSNLTLSSLVTSNYNGFGVSSPSACDGAVIATPNSGIAPYTFLWSNGGTSASNSSLCAGPYSVTTTDANGCTSTASGTLTAPAGVIPTVTQTSSFNGFGVSCDDKCDGHARLTVVGGALPYTVKWSTNKIDIINSVSGFSDIFNLCAGTYTVTVSDNNNVTSVGTVIITTPGPFYLELIQTRPTTLSACDGLILANAINGVGTVTYTYSVAGSPAQGTGPKIDDLCVDRKVTFFATDANGCTAIARDTVGYPSDGCFQVDPVITPGTLDGKNDLLTITCIESANSSSLQIFNRWGQLVFTAEGYTNFSSTSWDGNNSKKQLLPEGVYYYVLNFTDEENTNYRQKGYIHLIR